MNILQGIMQNIIITGGSSGFGKALTFEFCKRRHNVLITGRDMHRLKLTKEQMHAKTLGTCHTFQCDVSKYTDVANLALHAREVFNTNDVDHWINNAGLCEGPRKFCQGSFEDIDTIINTNLTGAMYCAKVATSMGTVKNLYFVSGHGSDASKTPDFAIYGATKAAISQFASTLTTELNGSTNVRIIAPGIMKTELSRRLLEDDTLNPVSKCVITFLATPPDAVAEKVVPKILSAKGTGIIIRGFP